MNRSQTDIEAIAQDLGQAARQIPAAFLQADETLRQELISNATSLISRVRDVAAPPGPSQPLPTDPSTNQTGLDERADKAFEAFLSQSRNMVPSQAPANALVTQRAGPRPVRNYITQTSTDVQSAPGMRRVYDAGEKAQSVQHPNPAAPSEQPCGGSADQSALGYYRATDPHWLASLEWEPTEEQCQIVRDFEQGKNLCVKALAGSAKTSTLRLCATRTTNPIVLITFNKVIAEEAKRTFPDHVQARTMHSFAWRAIVARNERFRRKLEQSRGRLSPSDIQRHAGLRANDGTEVSMVDRCDYVMRTLNAFLQSADESIGENHVPPDALAWIDLGNDQWPKDARQRYAQFLVRRSSVLYRAMVDADSECPITHDLYLKLYQLSRPILPAPVVMLDEAQDTNPVVLDIVARQQAQKVIVGDTYQSIYEWRGASGSMENLPGQERFLTHSFRFGPRIAEQANRVLRQLGARKPIVGAGSEPSNPELPDNQSGYTVLTRTNAGMIEEAQKLASGGVRMNIVGDFDAAARKMYSAFALYQMRPFDATDPEIARFGDWDTMVDYSRTGIGQEINRIVQFIHQFQCHTPEQIEVIRRHIDPTANIAISTIHKAKGLEWPAVIIANDFELDRALNLDETAIDDSQEFNLAYVAMTRAKQVLVLAPGIEAALSKLEGHRAVGGMS